MCQRRNRLTYIGTTKKRFETLCLAVFVLSHVSLKYIPTRPHSHTHSFRFNSVRQLELYMTQAHMKDAKIENKEKHFEFERTQKFESQLIFRTQLFLYQK